MSVDTILARLKGVKKKRNARWVAQCPAHKDKSPSLSIADLEDGRVLIHCFAGCDVESILDSLGLEMTDLFPERLADHLPAQRSRVHEHAASDVLKIMAHEALVVAIAVEALERGETLNETDFKRIVRAASILREASHNV